MSTMTKLTNGISTTLLEVITALQELPEQQVRLWASKWDTITKKVVELGIDVTGKTVGEVLQSLQQVLPAYPLIADLHIEVEAYIAEDSTTTLNIGFASKSVSFGYGRQSESRSAGNIKVGLHAYYSDAPRPIPVSELSPMLWSDFINRLDSFNFLEAK